MIRTCVLIASFLLGAGAVAADSCQEFAKLKELPAEFKTISLSALGPAKMEIKSNGKCTCNDPPAVERSLGQTAPEGVNWACEIADADEAKGK